MATERRIVDASVAQMAARRYLENQYGDNLVKLEVKKCWYSTGASKGVWDVEGVAEVKKDMVVREHRTFKCQIDSITNAVIWFEEHRFGVDYYLAGGGA